MSNKEKMLQILKAYYDKKMSNEQIDVNSFNLEDGRHEGAFYLSSLERDGFIEFEGEVIVPGGQRHQKYSNSVAAIWWSNAHITKSGENELKENNII
ncbi:hypothetical protein NST63_27315 [Heyndrickxia sp. FSL W8-0496]|uniref:hypothetical protein n=1 Tax=Heyndrickxia sp. FSL W8-0496 TaxID=2954702 RepID=UPI0030F574BA